MNIKPSIEARTDTKQQKRVKRVSVSLPSDVARQVNRFAKSERRLFSPALVVLIEKGLATVTE